MNNYYTTNPNEEYYIKHKARSCVNVLACTFIGSSALVFVFYILTYLCLPILQELMSSVLTNVCGDSELYADVFVKSFLQGEEFNYFVSILSTLVCCYLPFSVVSKKILKMPADIAAPMKGKILKSFPFIYCAMVLMGNLTSSVASGIFSFIMPDIADLLQLDVMTIYGTSTSAASLFLMFLSLCLVAPFVEEFVYRGVIFGYLRKFGFPFAAFVSSLMFAFSHPTIEQITYTFITGMVLCITVEKSGNLKTGILIHFINNLIAYLNTYIFPLLGSDIYSVIFETVYGIFLGIFAIIGMIVIFTSHKKQNAEDKLSAKDPTEYHVPFHCFWCVGTVLMILYAIFNVSAVLL